MEAELCREYLAGDPEARGKLEDAHSEDLAARFSAAIEQLGNLEVDARLYRERVLHAACERIAKSEGCASTLREVLVTLHYTDLYLACALGAGQPRAWQIFSERFDEFLRAAANKLTKDRSLAHEISGDLMADLFFTDRTDGRSRIMSYTGASSLDRWLWLVLRHRLIDVVRRRKREIPIDGAAGPGEEGGPRSGGDPTRCAPSAEEQVFAAERRRMLEVVIPAALSGLDPQERLLLKLVFAEGVKQRQVAQVMHVHESRVSRWIDRVKREVLGKATMQLTRDFGLSFEDADELIRLVREADVSADLAKLLDDPELRGAHCAAPLPGKPGRV